MRSQNKKIKKKCCDPYHIHLKGQFVFLWLVLATVQLRTKFEMSSFIHPRDRRGIPNFKSGSRDPANAFLRAIYLSLASSCHDPTTSFEMSSLKYIRALWHLCRQSFHDAPPDGKGKSQFPSHLSE